jgi:DNA gyrase/topoisomerase IV subunit B
MTVSSYSAQSIRQLEGLEAIRQLPGMYIGDNQLHGLHHLLYEIISNSVDEILNGHGTSVLVELHEDGSASVTDDARGIPVEWKPESQMSALTQVLTLLHAGGKFREAHNQTQDAYYAGSGGLHGIGAKATNAFSVWLEATVRRYGVAFK